MDLSNSFKKCNNCGKTSFTGINPLQRCSACKLVFYCSRDCQRHDWESHKQVCVQHLAKMGLAQSSTSSNNNNHPTNPTIQPPSNLNNANNIIPYSRSETSSFLPIYVGREMEEQLQAATYSRYPDYDSLENNNNNNNDEYYRHDQDNSSYSFSSISSFTSNSSSDMNNDSSSILHLLSEEIQFHIFSYLDPRSLIAVSYVCKQWNILSQDSQLWKDLIHTSSPKNTNNISNTSNKNSNNNNNNNTDTSLSQPTYRRFYTEQLLPPLNKWKKLFFEFQSFSRFINTHNTTNSNSNSNSNTTTPPLYTGYSLVQSGIEASSEDHPKQSIHQTLDGKDTTFWSSTGSKTMDATEWLVYKLIQPLCVIFQVMIQPYQASYQQGQPIYGPQSVQISVGFSPTSFHWKSPIIPVANTNKTVSLPVLPVFAFGGYVRLDFYGKYQTQMQDDLYYIALQTVRAVGTPVGLMSGFPLLSQSMYNYALCFPSFLTQLEHEPKYSKGIEEYKTSKNQAFLLALERDLIAEMIPLLTNEQQRKQSELRFLSTLKQGDFKNAVTFVTDNMRDAGTLECFRQQGVRALWVYFTEMISRNPPLNKIETLELFKFVLEEQHQRGKFLIAVLWMDRGKLTLSQELGDMLFTVDVSVALHVYFSLQIIDKILQCFIELKQYRRVVASCLLSNYRPDFLKMLKDVETNKSKLEAIKFALALAEMRGGSPVDLEQVCRVLELELSEDDWDFKKVLNRALQQEEQKINSTATTTTTSPTPGSILNYRFDEIDWDAALFGNDNSDDEDEDEEEEEDENDE